MPQAEQIRMASPGSSVRRFVRAAGASLSDFQGARGVFRRSRKSGSARLSVSISFIVLKTPVADAPHSLTAAAKKNARRWRLVSHVHTRARSTRGGGVALV